MAVRAVRAGKSRDVGGLPVEAKLLPAPPPGAVELNVMVEVTVPFAGRVTVEVEKEQVGGSLGVPLPL